MSDIGKVQQVKIEDEMRTSYLDYAMSVIVSRALPDVRDGLKPVQRRILYAMHEMHVYHNTSYRKSARIVGDVMGKYHPHGDSPIYEALVRLAQDFSMRYTLIDGQGNFGSVDNDPPAAMRYTEARLSKIAQEMLVNIDKDTVNFSPNFDSSLQEPSVLPARLPNLLVNGSSGIAVGMATSIPPHNLSEICNAIICLIDNPAASIEEVIKFVQGPDFPTGGIILGRDEIQKAYTSGRGKVIVRAKTHREDDEEGRQRIIVDELPYQTNKATLIARIADLVKEKRVEGITELRDESDRQGMRIVIGLKKEAQLEQVRNTLYKYTAMQSSFFINMLALVDGQPKVLSLKEALQNYIDFRYEVITRRSKFDLEKAKARAHILEGLKIALDNLDQVIKLIRQSETAEIAREQLMTSFSLSQIQAQAILDMQLRRLANMERQQIIDEYTEVLKTINYLEDLLANPKKILYLVKEETIELKKEYGDERKTQISDQGPEDFKDDDLIPHEDVIITLSTEGYIKRQPIATYRLQHRGGRGVIGVKTREKDVVRILLDADTHDDLLFFTDRGRVFRLKCYEISADISRTTKGTPLINLIAIEQDEKITAVIKVTEYISGKFMLMATRRGEIKRTSLDDFSSVRRNGLIAMSLEKGDELQVVTLADANEHVIMVTSNGQAVHFPVSKLRVASRTSGGVRGIRCNNDCEVVGMSTCTPEYNLLVITTSGFGKMAAIKSFPITNRGGVGVRAQKITENTGKVAAALCVSQDQELMVISKEGIIIRMPVKDIPVIGRATQGVWLMRLEEGDEVATVTCLSSSKVTV